MRISGVSLGLGLFAASLAAGWWLGRVGVLTRARVEALIRLVVKRLSPLVLCLLFWGLRPVDARIWWMPVIGLLVSLAAGLPAWWYARRAALPPPQAGSFLTCAIFSNVGYLGAFVAFALYGEAAYALATLYYLTFSPLFYFLGFTIARRTSPASAATRSGADELRLYPFLGVMAGLLLRFSGVPRPALLGSVSLVLIPVDTILYLVAIGSQLTFEVPRGLLRHCLAMSAIKFIYTPLVGWALATAFGVQGLGRFIILLEGLMPVAISPLMLPLLFGLDQRLSNAVWLFTTVLALPILLVALPLIASW